MEQVRMTRGQSVGWLRRACHQVSLAALVTLVGLAVATSLPGSVEARPRPANKARKKFEANKTFGLGLMLGAPSGLSGKYYLGRDTALAFGVGTIYEYRDREGIHLHGDFLWHPMSLASTRSFELPLYFGVGARFLSGSRCYRYDNNGNSRFCSDSYDGYQALGIRAPLGIAFDFNNVPLDIFLEIVLVADFLVDHDDGYDENVLYLDMNGAIGVRYFFE